MAEETSIILPQTSKKVVEGTTSYWAAFYCSILKTVRYQKTLSYRWGDSKSLQDYKGELRESGFFKSMKNTILNHAFEYVMVDFLKTKTGIDVFKNLCGMILGDHEFKDFDITLMNVFKVGTDSEIFNAATNYHSTKVLMLLPGGIRALPDSKIPGYCLNDTLKYSDLFIMISNGEETIGFVGEVEGHHGEKLFRTSYFENNSVKNKYCTFCVGVSDKGKHAETLIKEKVSLNKDEAIGRWTLHFSKSNYYIGDYHHAIENTQNLIEGHLGYMEKIEDEGHLKVLNIIKNYWKKDIVELISALESLVEFAFPSNNFHYQESIDGKVVYRPSPLILPDQLHLYAIAEDTASQQIITPGGKLF